jgi:PhoD-like phosphatase, N-terminal domain/PhoD-like phosphatase
MRYLCIPYEVYYNKHLYRRVESYDEYGSKEDNSTTDYCHKIWILLAVQRFILRLLVTMKSSLSLAFALAAGYAVSLVSCGNIPTEEMMFAKTMEEFERLRLHASSGMNDESMRTEFLRRRLDEKSQPLLASYFGGTPGFYHGVASGDPLPDAIILWTRYTPVTVTAIVTLELRISPIIPTLPVSSHLDPALNPSLRRVNIEVTSASDWVAKVDVTGLPSGTNFIYAFSDGTRVSDIGQTKTAPPLDADTSQLIYAVFSCSHFSNGYFHPYDVASTIKDLDFWMHVGDYVVRYMNHGLFLLPSNP